MRTHSIALSLSTLLLLSACEDPADGADEAVVTEVSDQTPTEQGPASAERESLGIDTDASTFGFIGSKVTGSHEGRFDRWSGSVELDPTDVTRSRVSIRVEMASVNADSPRLTNHLRTDDFFDVANHPTSTFESTSIAARSGDGDATHRIEGRLTLRGQTRQISFPARIEVSAREVRARARFTIDRQQFGISYRGMEDDLINDEVVIQFDVRAPRS